MMLHYLFLLIFSWFHPLHLSISELVLNQKTNSLEISHRIFIDDLEAALKEQNGQVLDLTSPKDPQLAKEVVGDYLRQHFRLQLNGKTVQPQYLGYEVEEDAIWAYMEVPRVRQLRSVNVQNTLFFKRFTDQMNLINVTVGKELKSLRLQADSPNGDLQFKK
jgi:hypothetical protein